MPPAKSPKRVEKSPAKKPPPSPKPVTPSRSSSRKVSAPRLGVDDGFGITSASKWSSEEATGSVAKSPARKADAKKSVSAVGAPDVLVLGAGVASWFYMIMAIVGNNGSLMGNPPLGGLASTAVAISLPQLSYVYVWNRPATFKKWCSKGLLGKILGKKPVTAFKKIVLLGKLIQQLALFLWAFYLCHKETTLSGAWNVLSATAMPQLLCSIALLAVGQVLNVSIYRAIGEMAHAAARPTTTAHRPTHSLRAARSSPPFSCACLARARARAPPRSGDNGVYYGFKLGAPVPWSTAFPFSAGFRHPQYVGGYLSQLGVLLLLAHPATISMGLVPIALLWFGLYALNSAVEASGDADQ